MRAGNEWDVMRRFFSCKHSFSQIDWPLILLIPERQDAALVLFGANLTAPSVIERTHQNREMRPKQHNSLFWSTLIDVKPFQTETQKYVFFSVPFSVISSSPLSQIHKYFCRSCGQNWFSDLGLFWCCRSSPATKEGSGGSKGHIPHPRTFSSGTHISLLQMTAGQFAPVR